MLSSGLKLAEDKAVLEYVLWFRMDREDAGFSEIDYKAAKKYVKTLSPQMQGKLRKEILEESQQVLAEMEEVRTCPTYGNSLRKTDRPGKAQNHQFRLLELALKRWSPHSELQATI